MTHLIRKYTAPKLKKARKSVQFMSYDVVGHLWTPHIMRIIKTLKVFCIPLPFQIISRFFFSKKVRTTKSWHSGNPKISDQVIRVIRNCYPMSTKKTHYPKIQVHDNSGSGFTREYPNLTKPTILNEFQQHFKVNNYDSNQFKSSYQLSTINYQAIINLR